MIQKTIAALMIVLALTASAPVATADVDLPVCYPCDDGPK